jgi:hypothetical protein
MDLPSPMAVLWFLATIVDCIICQLQNAKESILLISGYISGANFYFSVVVQHLSVTHQSLSNVSLVFFQADIIFYSFFILMIWHEIEMEGMALMKIWLSCFSS